MVELSKITLNYDGELILNGLGSFVPNYEVKKKIPSGIIELKYNISIKKGKFANQGDVSYEILPEYSLIRLGGQIISWGLPQKLELSPSLSEDLKFSHFLDQHSLKIVEDQRNNDVQFDVEIIGKYLAKHGGGPSFIQNDFGVFQLSFNWKLSQAEWLSLLSTLGYSEKLIIEIDRPKIEDFADVVNFIYKSEEDLYRKSDPEAVMDDLRRARNSFDEDFNKFREKVYEFIDNGSVGEKDHPPKSERIGIMYDAMSNWLNIGPHGEKYKVSYQDALLGYREFVAMLAYLSSVLTEAQRKETED